MDIRRGYFDLKRNLLQPGGQVDLSLMFDDSVVGMARRIYPSLEEWAKRYPIVLPDRLISMCLDSVAMSPSSPPRTMLQSAILCLILFAIDDLADGTIDSLTDEQIHSILQLYSDITSDPAGCPPDRSEVVALMGSTGVSAPWFQIAAAHGELCRDLACGAPPGTYAFFENYFNACMREMRTECRFRRAFIDRGDLPTLESYMVAAEYSIGAPAVWGALLPLDGYRTDILAASHSELLALCDQVVLAGARCIRLANDARSFAREIQFEQKPNSILIVMKQHGLGQDGAEAFIAERRERAQGEMLALIARLPIEMSEWGKSVRRFCESIKNWYLVMELHDAPAQMRRLFAEFDLR